MACITEEQYALLHPHLPVQRGNVLIPNIVIVNALLHILENGCKWRALPERYGKWHTVYMRLRRWAEAGVLARLLAALREQELTDKDLDCLGLDSTSVKVHPDGTGAQKKRARKASANPAAAGTRRST